MYYKVLTTTLKSPCAYKLTKQYRLGCWNHANRIAYKLGYGLCVFENLIQVSSFVRHNEHLLFVNGCSVFQCEVKRIMPELPNRLGHPTIKLMKMDGLVDRGWPIGTVMVGSLRLRHEIAI